jgi:eukaryotic-like serine/threonine-protein kinase
MRVLSSRSHYPLTPRSYRASMADAGEWGFSEGDEIVPGRHAVRLLGGGHRFEAFLAWDDAMRALVVAKLLRPGLVDSSSERAGLAREAKALARLQHPTIVRSFDAVLVGQRPHVLLEFLDGPRLSTLRRRFGVIIEQVLPLALELCSALHYMHAKGYVHLDVKPRNVVMSSRPRLIDLSVARTFAELTNIASPIGTDAYMAPEQCDPERFSEIGPASDIWGLGVTLYEALARELPFPTSDDEPYPQLTGEPRPLPSSIPAPLADAVSRCLDDRPEARPTADGLARELEPLVAALPAPRLGRFRPGRSMQTTSA